MLKTFVLLLPCYIYMSAAYAQVVQSSKKDKPVIDSMAVATWKVLSTDLQISNNGQYFLYNVKNQPINGQTLVIQATTGSWKKQFPGATSPYFTNTSKQVTFSRNDTLFHWQLGTDNNSYIPDVNGFKKYQESNHEWLAYTRKRSSDLVLCDWVTGRERCFNV